MSSRDKILEVAEELFARRGYAGVGLREVADSVGLGKSSLFHHFRGKSQLYFEVLYGVLARIRAHLEPVLADRGDPLQRLLRWVDALVDAFAEHPTSARLLLRALVEDEIPREQRPAEADACERLVDEMIDAARRLLREGAAAGVFRPVSEAHTVQTVIGATVYHFASGELGESVLGAPLLSADAVAGRKRELRELFRRGLAADGSVQPPASKEGDPWRS